MRENVRLWMYRKNLWWILALLSACAPTPAERLHMALEQSYPSCSWAMPEMRRETQPYWGESEGVGSFRGLTSAFLLTMTARNEFEWDCQDQLSVVTARGALAEGSSCAQALLVCATATR